MTSDQSAIDAALQKAQAARPVRTDFEMNADTRTVTVVATEMPVSGQIAALLPPEPIRIDLLWGHLKAIAGAIYQHESAELQRTAQQHPDDLERAHMLKVSELKRTLARKMSDEAATELAANRKLPGFDV